MASADLKQTIIFEDQLERKNMFDGNLVHGAKKFHSQTNRSGEGRAVEGGLVREHAKVVTDSGIDRYHRIGDCWEPVDKCPVCHSPNRQFFLSRLGLDIYECSNCSHRYQHPRLTFQKACELYSDDKTASDIYTQPLQKEIDSVKYSYGLDIISKLAPGHFDKIMDFGCGAGLFLEVAHQRGWKQCIGIDANSRYKSQYKNCEGIQYIQANFESVDSSLLGSGYDCITLWNVLEHLYDLDSILSSLKLLLKPGGLLFIMIPNVESLATRLIREKSATFNWKHVSHFSPSSLRYLMDKYQFPTIHIETAISEIDNIKSYMSGRHPYHGHCDPDNLYDFITPEYIHANLLGSRIISVFKNA